MLWCAVVVVFLCFFFIPNPQRSRSLLGVNDRRHLHTNTACVQLWGLNRPSNQMFGSKDGSRSTSGGLGFRGLEVLGFWGVWVFGGLGVQGFRGLGLKGSWVEPHGVVIDIRESQLSQIWAGGRCQNRPFFQSRDVRYARLPRSAEHCGRKGQVPRPQMWSALGPDGQVSDLEPIGRLRLSTPATTTRWATHERERWVQG